MNPWATLMDVITAWFKNPLVSYTHNFSETGYTSMRDVITLINAICDVYDRNDYKPSADGETHCNQAVNAVAEAMGCHDLDNKTADGIAEFISTNDGWSDIPFEKAQDMANQGS